MTFPQCQCGAPKATHETLTGDRLCIRCFLRRGQRIHDGLSPVPLPVPEPLPALVCIVCTTVLDTTELLPGIVLLDGKPTCQPCADDIITRTKPDSVFKQEGTQTGRVSANAGAPAEGCRTPDGMDEYDKRVYDCGWDAESIGCTEEVTRYTRPEQGTPELPECPNGHGPMPVKSTHYRADHVKATPAPKKSAKLREQLRATSKAVKRLDPTIRDRVRTAKPSITEADCAPTRMGPPDAPPPTDLQPAPLTHERLRTQGRRKAHHDPQPNADAEKWNGFDQTRQCGGCRAIFVVHRSASRSLCPRCQRETTPTDTITDLKQVKPDGLNVPVYLTDGGAFPRDVPVSHLKAQVSWAGVGPSAARTVDVRRGTHAGMYEFTLPADLIRQHGAGTYHYEVFVGAEPIQPGSKLAQRIDATFTVYASDAKPFQQPATTAIECPRCDRLMHVRSGALEPQGFTTDDDRAIWHRDCLKEHQREVNPRNAGRLPRTARYFEPPRDSQPLCVGCAEIIVNVSTRGVQDDHNLPWHADCYTTRDPKRGFADGIKHLLEAGACPRPRQALFNTVKDFDLALRAWTNNRADDVHAAADLWAQYRDHTLRLFVQQPKPAAVFLQAYRAVDEAVQHIERACAALVRVPERLLQVPAEARHFRAAMINLALAQVAESVRERNLYLNHLHEQGERPPSPVIQRWPTVWNHGYRGRFDPDDLRNVARKLASS